MITASLNSWKKKFLGKNVMTKTIITVVAGLLLFVRTAAADPVVLDISFGSELDAAETAFGIFADPTPSLEDDIIFDPFSAFDAGSDPAPIAYDPLASAPFGDFGYAPVFSLGLAPVFTSLNYLWDLGPGAYAFILFDLDGFFGLGGGSFDLSVNGISVGSGDGAFENPSSDFFGIARIDFAIEGKPPIDVPEPGTLGLLGLGLLGLAATRRRRR